MNTKKNIFNNLNPKIQEKFATFIYMFNKEKRHQARQKIIEDYALFYLQEDIKKIEKKYSKYWILMPAEGLGEIFMVASLLKQFKKQYSGKILFLTFKESTVELLEHFDKIDEVLLIDKKVYDYHAALKGNYLRNKKGIVFPVFSTTGGPGPEVLTDNYFDLHKEFLRLDDDCELANATLTDKNNILNKYNMIGYKTIFLSPYANSLNYKVLSFDFWIKLADEFKKRGYNVVFNIHDEKQIDYQICFENLYNAAVIAKNSDYIITFRSGLTDMFAAVTNTEMIVLFPPEGSQVYEYASNEEMLKIAPLTVGKTLAEELFLSCSISNMYKKENVTDMMVHNDEELLIKTLLNKVEQSKKALV